jgi:hypothetical protein
VARIRAVRADLMSRKSGARGAVWFHRSCALVWALMAVPALLWWPDSVAFVIVASIYANVKSDWGAAEAADDSQVLDKLEKLERRIAAGQCRCRTEE